MMRTIVFFLLLSSSSVAWSQCNNSIKVKDAVYQAIDGNGKIELTISGQGNFVCTLNIEKGSGLTKLSSKKGTGSSTVIFESLTNEQMYLVEVEFLNEENKLCRKLQKSQIILESK